MINRNLASAASSQPPPKLAFTRHEAAHLISQSPATLDRLVQRGLLHPSRATRRPLFSREELERFLRETSGNID
jgi:ribosomal protein S20